MPKNLDQMIFVQNLKQAIFLGLAIIIFGGGYIAYGLNVPVSQEELSGKVTQSYIVPAAKSAVSITAFVRLENGRIIQVILPRGAALPLEGSAVIVIRYVKRFLVIVSV